MLNKENYVKIAEETGFKEAELIKVKDIIFDYGFRKYCEENLCGFYGNNYACPPYCGTPEEMEKKVRRFENALVLKTAYNVADAMNASEMNPLKKKHTQRTLSYIQKVQQYDKKEYLGIMAGPCSFCDQCKMPEGKPCVCEELRFSCLSAYCIDVTKLAKTCGMSLSWDLHSASFFSIYLFD